MPENTLFSHRTDASDKQLFSAEHPIWKQAEIVDIERYWNGKSPIKNKGSDWKNLTEIQSAWTEEAVYFRFRCWFDELNVNPEWSKEEPVHGLWEKDVVEVFIRPDSCDDYFEIEISPLGQYLDAHIRKPRIEVNWSWNSRLRRSVSIDSKKRTWHAFLALPFEPILGPCGSKRFPMVGDAWRVNLFRTAGEGEKRDYLAWSPTFTPRPDFHVPSAFGNLIFLDDR